MSRFRFLLMEVMLSFIKFGRMRKKILMGVSLMMKVMILVIMDLILVISFSRVELVL